MTTVLRLLLALAVPLALLYGLWWLTARWCPPAAWLLRRGGQRLWRGIQHWLWSAPMRQFGCLFTGVFWLAALASLLTFAALAALGSGGGAGPLVLAALAWGGVYLAWRGAAWWYRRRYTPRTLPNRRRVGRGREP